MEQEMILNNQHPIAPVSLRTDPAIRELRQEMGRDDDLRELAGGFTDLTGDEKCQRVRWPGYYELLEQNTVAIYSSNNRSGICSRL